MCCTTCLSATHISGCPDADDDSAVIAWEAAYEAAERGLQLMATACPYCPAADVCDHRRAAKLALLCLATLAPAAPPTCEPEAAAVAVDDADRPF